MKTDCQRAPQKPYFMRAVLCSLLFIFPLFGGNHVEGEEPDVFQATIRGNGTAGAVVFSPSNTEEFVGNVVVFLKGRMFAGKSRGRIEGGKLKFTFEASAAPDAMLANRSLTGSFEATGEPQKFFGSGSILVPWEKNSPMTIKVSGIKTPDQTRHPEKCQKEL